ncbi:MAG TPA: hypothetical protein VH575_00950 [Gemmataceae bacterium]|jgi:hypothetical protein
METRNDESQRPQTQNDAPKGLKSRLERWIEKLEERIAPFGYCQHYNPQGKLVGHHCPI